MARGEIIIELLLGTAFAIAIIYLLIRYYIASRENAKKQFLYELVNGDWPFIPFEGRIGEAKAGAGTRGAGGVRQVGRQPSDTRNQNKSLRTGTGAK